MLGLETGGLHNGAQLTGIVVGGHGHAGRPVAIRGRRSAVLPDPPKQNVVVAHPAHLGPRVLARRDHALKRQVGQPGLVHRGEDRLALHVKNHVAHEVAVDLGLPASALLIARAQHRSDRKSAGSCHRVALSELKHRVPRGPAAQRHGLLAGQSAGHQVHEVERACVQRRAAHSADSVEAGAQVGVSCRHRGPSRRGSRQSKGPSSPGSSRARRFAPSCSAGGRPGHCSTGYQESPA